jgi:tetratricopeptide (TPR) repeat protein
MRILIVAFALTLIAGNAAGQKNEYQLLNDSIDRHEKDPAGLAQDLAQAEALVAKLPAAPAGHWVRARALDALNRVDEAIAEYVKAAALPAFAGDAHYNIGLMLERNHRLAEAMAEYRSALRADPKNADAAYNIAQAAYLDGNFAEALDKWTLAKQLTPDNFQVARKLVQTYYALGRDADAARARDEVLRIRTQAKDPDIATVTTWVFDQIVLPKGRVYAREPFDNAEYLMRFDVGNANDDIVGNLEFVRDGDHWILRPAGTPSAPAAPRTYTSRPSWRDLQPAVRDMATTAFPVTK